MLAVVLSSTLQKFTVKLFLLSAQSHKSSKLKKNAFKLIVSNRSCPPSQTLHLQLLFMMSGHQLSIGNLRLLTLA